LPAIEVFGEGIFLKFSDLALTKWERKNKRELESRLQGIAASLSTSKIAQHRFPNVSSAIARFIAIHTFTHLFMRQLCFEAGYGLSAIRERPYVSPSNAGVLVYTADGDSEGSLGGLVRQGKGARMADTVIAAIERAAWCSNDPICGELPENSLDGLNLSACQACGLLPETSCSHFNLLLDRQLVIGDGRDGRTLGLFSTLLQ
jgi:hypothetical protein